MSYRHLLAGTGTAAILSLIVGATAQAQTVLTTSNGIVRSSLCVGTDCQTGISFSDSTIIVKENNTRIKFADTSTVNSFPRNDWELEANSQTNGGPNRFSIFDCGEGSNDGGCSAPNNVFSVEAGAGSNALYVDDGGRVGLGTSTPSVELHVIDGDTPTLRLQQDGSSGFAAQTWDVAGNETNFFVRDVTSGSTLPLRIRPGAPSSAIDVAASGDIGMGTSSPDASLHVRGTDDVQLRVEETGAGFAQLIDLINNGAPRMQWDNSATASVGVWQMGLTDPGDNFLIRDQTGGQNSFTLEAGGNLTILGTLTENSDKTRKMAIEPVDPATILEKVSALPVASWTYKHDAESGIRHIGPMAQDFHAAFGVGQGPTGISTLDTSGVALAAIQALTAENEALRLRIELLERKFAD